MDFDSLRKILARANLGLSPDMVGKVWDFLENHIGRTSEDMQEDAFAALGIVSEVQEMKSVDSGSLVGCGIPLETVLRHIHGLSKQALLQVATRQSMKWREAPKWLSLKIDEVKLAYRIYKKYRAVFEKMTRNHCCAEDSSRDNLMAIFWIVYLYTKNHHQRSADLLQVTTILYCLFLFLFGEVLTDLTEGQITQYFKEQFPESVTPTQSEYNFYRLQILSHMTNIHQWRYKNQELNLQTLATDQNFMMRFLDDIANNYDRYKLSLPRHSVDEISFLELDKTLTPQAIKRDYTPPQASICKPINFDEEDEEPDEENRSPNAIEPEPVPVMELNVPKQRRMSLSQRREPMSPFRPLQSHHYNISPIRARHQNLGWVNSITSRAYEKDIEAIRAIFENYTKHSFESYLENALKNLSESISEFTPSCMDYQKRQRSIFCFFSYIVSKIHEKHQQDERKIIFGKISSYDSILCLSVNLFNFAYQSLQSSYRQYCQIFGVGLVQGQLTINWLGCNVEMPKNLEGYLYDLEKKILIQEIWEQGEGYELLTNASSLYQGQAIFKRLKKHADERTQELCESMRIDDKQITKVVNLVRFILDKRQGLLKDQKIDQIIVCSIASILSINRSRNFSLGEIFEHYNRLLYSLNISKSIFYQGGREIDLIDYYNHVFLNQVEEIISNQEQAMKVLDTPVRIDRKTRMEMGKDMTPISNKFRQLPAIGGLGSRRLKPNEEKGTYVNKQLSFKQRLVSKLNQKIKITDEKDEEQENDEPPSPSFGGCGLNRMYSFGELGERDKF